MYLMLCYVMLCLLYYVMCVWDMSIRHQIINRAGEGIAATYDAGRSIEGFNKKNAPSDLHKKNAQIKKFRVVAPDRHECVCVCYVMLCM